MLAGVAFAALLSGAGCAADPGDRTGDAGAERDVPPDRAAETMGDSASDRPTDGFAPGPDVAAVVEPPLAVRMCGADPTCCASALGFEDGTTQHFLPASCCRLALSTPQLVPTPTVCGHGALKLSAEFRATDASAMCGTPAGSLACTYTAGEVTRAVLAPLTLAGRTLSLMVYLQGPSLPPNPVHASLFVVGTTGTLEGPAVPLTGTAVWTRIEFAVPPDPGGPGADVQVLGFRMTFGGQSWLGQVYLDELSWR